MQRARRKEPNLALRSLPLALSRERTIRKGLRARIVEGAANHSSRLALSPLRIALRQSRETDDERPMTEDRRLTTEDRRQKSAVHAQFATGHRSAVSRHAQFTSSIAK